MEFKSIKIKNFRNFENIEIDLNNKNVFFGVNDIGKTNFLYAIRFLLDAKMRITGLSESNFYNKDIDKIIEIILEIEINNDNESEKLIAKDKGALESNKNNLIIKLEAKYVEDIMLAIPEMYGGSDRDNLMPMKEQNKGFYEIDSIINIIYIDAYVNLNTLLKKSIKELIKNEDGETNPNNEIQETLNTLNEQVSNISSMKNFQKSLSEEYAKIKNDDIQVKINSEIEINNIYANTVILVEGEYERILFDAILSIEHPNYEVLGGYILVIDGIEFNKYIEILHKLNIKCIVKIDNDIKIATKKDKQIEYNKLGLTRINKILEIYEAKTLSEDTMKNYICDKEPDESEKIEIKREIYSENKELLENHIREEGIFLSEVDLENDLDTVLDKEVKKEFLKKSNKKGLNLVLVVQN